MRSTETRSIIKPETARESVDSPEYLVQFRLSEYIDLGIEPGQTELNERITAR